MITLLYYVLYYYIICYMFFHDLSRKMRRNKLAPEARKQRRAPEKLKMTSKQAAHYYCVVIIWIDPGSIQDRSRIDPGSIQDRSIGPTHFFGRSVILAGAKFLAKMCMLSMLV